MPLPLSLSSRRRRVLALLLLQALLAALSLQAVQAQAQTPAVAVDNGRMLDGVKRVAITQVVLQFIDRQDGSAVSGGFGGGASAKAAVRLAGPGAEQYQRITEAVYQELLRTVQAAGLELVPHEQLAAQPDWAKLKEAGKPSPVEDEKFSGYGGWVYSPADLPVVFDSDDEESFMQSNRDPDPRGEQYRSMGSLLGGNSTAARWAEWGLAKALDAHLLKLRITVPLAIVKTSGGILSGGASVKVEPLPRLARDVTRFTFRREREAARLRLDRHLLLPADLLSVETVAKSADNTGGIGRALGLLGSNSAAGEYRLNADPARYEAEVLAAARATLAAFGQTLKARRNPS
ncbi:MAG: hypothetical protein KBC73_17045 [Burkholderiaceae bacterium]|nr:hypothetical protein [Burkholderiaceae bacterium]